MHHPFPLVSMWPALWWLSPRTDWVPPFLRKNTNYLLLWACVFHHLSPNISIDFLTQTSRKQNLHSIPPFFFSRHVLLRPLAISLDCNCSCYGSSDLLIAKPSRYFSAHFLLDFSKAVMSMPSLKRTSCWLEVIHSFCCPPSFVFLHPSFDKLWLAEHSNAIVQQTTYVVILDPFPRIPLSVPSYPRSSRSPGFAHVFLLLLTILFVPIAPKFILKSILASSRKIEDPIVYSKVSPEYLTGLSISSFPKVNQI